MPFSPEEDAHYRRNLTELVELYRRVKVYVIASEKAAEGDKISLPAINELRNSFDHVMRASAVYYSLSNVPAESGSLSPASYCKTNISKAMGHLYRAGYDALDVISLAKTSSIFKIIESIRHTTLVTVFHQYSDDIRIPLEKAISECDAAKASKDVESDDAGKINFQKYEDAIRMLEQVRNKLHSQLPELTRVDQEKSMDFKVQRNWAIVGVAVTILFAILFSPIIVDSLRTWRAAHPARAVNLAPSSPSTSNSTQK